MDIRGYFHEFFRTACFFFCLSDFIYLYVTASFSHRLLSSLIFPHFFFSFISFTSSVLLFFSDKIEVYPGDPSFFIFHVIPHITTIFCNLTGFCNVFRSTGFSVKIERNSLWAVLFQLLFEWLTQFFFSDPRYIFRTSSSFLWQNLISESTRRFPGKKSRGISKFLSCKHERIFVF